MADEPFEIRLSRRAERDLQNLGRQAQVRIARAIDRLAGTPRPRGAKLLTDGGPPRIWRVRIGDYRILYEIRDDEHVVLVIAVGHRGVVYRSR